MSVTHTFVNPIADDPTFTGTKPSDWNAAHTVSIVDADIAIAAAIVESKLSLNYPTHAAATVADTTSLNLTLAGQQISGDVNFGTGAGVAAEGNHVHAGIYEPVDATIVRTGDVNYTDLTDGGATTLHTHAATAGFTQRIFSANVALANGECTTFINYIKLGTYSLTLAGDSAVMIL